MKSTGNVLTKRKTALLARWIKELDYKHRMCFANAQRLTSISDGKLLYHEGVLGWKAHAWNSFDGVVIDVAFNNAVVDPDVADAYIAKVTATVQEVHRNSFKHGHCWNWFGDPESYGEIWKPYVAPVIDQV